MTSHAAGVFRRLSTGRVLKIGLHSRVEGAGLWDGQPGPARIGACRVCLCSGVDQRRRESFVKRDRVPPFGCEIQVKWALVFVCIPGLWLRWRRASGSGIG